MECIDGRERSFAIGNKEISRDGVVARQANLYLASLVAIAMLLGYELIVESG